ncbi:MAG: sugar phosphate isomerase/epimerase [Planctomycetales bacterium]|nr:sugar phosphate isomerase/epimerase [bacterium]UNM06880.1 MAG: sugar phosphate isomerase/epimerase [Planctomycetales bacterium]
MDTGICTLVDLDVPIDELVRAIAAAGFSHVSLSHDPAHAFYQTADGRARLRDLLDETGLRLNYIHAPLARWVDLASLDEQTRRASIELTKLALKACGELDGNAVVAHVSGLLRIPDSQLDAMAGRALESLDELAAYAGEHGVMLCIENLPGIEDCSKVTLRVMRMLENDDIHFCVDPCHATILNPDAVELMRMMAPRVKATHLSDTMGEADSHLIPYEGNVDWGSVTSMLGEAGYDGVVDLESSLWMLRMRHDQHRLHREDPLPCSLEKYLEKAQLAARRLGEQIRAARRN